jgi:putative phosphoesterase
MRIGVVADTHCPEFLPELPPRLGEALKGVDLIVHAGDVGGIETLRELERIAPVEAVRGDHDDSLQGLPLSRVLTLGGRQVALIHGNRSHLVEEPVTFVGTVSLGYIWPKPGLHAWLRRLFPAADVIVYGHTHVVAQSRRAGQLVFNPGAVYQVSRAEARARLARRPDWFEWSWLQVMRHRRRFPGPTVGILELNDSGFIASVIPL